MRTSIGSAILAVVASTSVAQLVWAVLQTDDPCQPIKVPGAFVGIGGIDKDKGHATLAYVQEILHRAVKPGDCTPCPADRYSWADFVHQEIGMEQDPANLTSEMFRLLAVQYRSKALTLAQTKYKASCVPLG